MLPPDSFACYVQRVTDMGVEGLMPLKRLTALYLGCCHRLADDAARHMVRSLKASARFARSRRCPGQFSATCMQLAFAVALVSIPDLVRTIAALAHPHLRSGRVCYGHATVASGSARPSCPIVVEFANNRDYWCMRTCGPCADLHFVACRSWRSWTCATAG